MSPNLSRLQACLLMGERTQRKASPSFSFFLILPRGSRMWVGSLVMGEVAEVARGSRLAVTGAEWPQDPTLAGTGPEHCSSHMRVSSAGGLLSQSLCLLLTSGALHNNPGQGDRGAIVLDRSPEVIEGQSFPLPHSWRQLAGSAKIPGHPSEDQSRALTWPRAVSGAYLRNCLVFQNTFCRVHQMFLG